MKGRILCGYTVKLRKADKSSFVLLENDIPQDLDPITYLIAYLAALICCGEEFT